MTSKINYADVKDKCEVLIRLINTMQYANEKDEKLEKEYFDVISYELETELKKR